jgi:hypothetical protein
MKRLALALAVVAVAAVAANPWTTHEYSESYDRYVYYDGQYYWGTISNEISYQWKDNGKNYLYRGRTVATFEAADGTLSGTFCGTYSDKIGHGSALTATENGHYKWYDGEGRLIEVENAIFHQTFNANGELISYH